MKALLFRPLLLALLLGSLSSAPVVSMMARGSEVTARKKAPTKKKAEAPLAKAASNRVELSPSFLLLPNQTARREEVEKSGLAPELVATMLQGRSLKLDEIAQAAAKGVSVDTLIRYLRYAGSIYQLTTKDIDRLRAARVSDALIDYLLTTRSPRPTIAYPSLFYSPWLHHFDDWHHSDHHFSDLHHSETHFGHHDHH